MSCCCCSVAKLGPTLCNAMGSARQASPFTVSLSLHKLMSIESVMPSNHLILCHCLLLLPSIFPRIRAFSNELALCIRIAKALEFQLYPQSFQYPIINIQVDFF